MQPRNRTDRRNYDHSLSLIHFVRAFKTTKINSLNPIDLFAQGSGAEIKES